MTQIKTFRLRSDLSELILIKTTSACGSHCEEVDLSKGDGCELPLKMADRRERIARGEKNIGRRTHGERETERQAHRGSGKRNEKISLRIGCIYTLGGPGCAPCPASRHGRGRGGDCDVGGSIRIDRVWAATNPRLSSLPLRFVDPFLLFSPLFYCAQRIPLFSVHSSFFFSPRVLCISCAFSLFSLHSSVLSSCILLIMPL